ncbi:MAG: glycerophosphodiester phosphodiesterase [Candidatus Obscuribacterales bacterium]|nr:glycerophosphodiester phosphodiesterase [Candidatus Obscuribacterales bacterium]
MFKSKSRRFAVLAASVLCASFTSAVNIPVALAAQNKPLVIAHRGGRKTTPENTLSAFKHAIESGADGIELDIHKCKSGELIVIHDETVNRTSNGKGFVKDMTLAELKKLDAGTWFNEKFKGEKFPTLKEVFDLVDGKGIINIEIKNSPVAYPTIEKDLISLLDAYKYPDKIVISSFDHNCIKRIHDKTSKYKLAFLDDAVVYDVGGYAKKIGASGWNPHFGELRPDVMAEANKVPIEVNVWTVNEKKDWQEMKDLSVHSIITDDPDGLIDWLKTANSKK